MSLASKRIARQRIQVLMNLAETTFHEKEMLSQRYAAIARKIAMASRIHLPRDYRHQICRHCKRYILSGVTSRTRIRQRREPHVVITCLYCGRQMRIPLSKRGKKEHGK